MDWSYLQGFLFEMGKFVFVSNFVLLIIAVAFERKVSSVVISFIVLALSSGIMSAATPMLYEISSQPGIIYKLVWYGGFAFIDCVSLYLLFKLHKLLRQNVSLVAIVLGCALLIFTLLQSLRFIDRFIFNTEVFAELYRNAIPALNIILVPMLIFFWLREGRAKQPLSQEVTQ
ncbi:hypothetical protein [Rheinheimera pacifica]|uniref:hypothetical protein n=1 Tax=Rheinheimera pacifica TaxID=173990 RepID=UPI002EDB4988